MESWHLSEEIFGSDDALRIFRVQFHSFPRRNLGAQTPRSAHDVTLFLAAGSRPAAWCQRREAGLSQKSTQSGAPGHPSLAHPQHIPLSSPPGFLISARRILGTSWRGCGSRPSRSFTAGEANRGRSKERAGSKRKHRRCCSPLREEAVFHRGSSSFRSGCASSRSSLWGLSAWAADAPSALSAPRHKAK